jgi:hypothetical protein
MGQVGHLQISVANPVTALASAPTSESPCTRNACTAGTSPHHYTNEGVWNPCQHNTPIQLAVCDIIKAESRANPYLHSSNRRVKV